MHLNQMDKGLCADKKYRSYGKQVRFYKKVSSSGIKSSAYKKPQLSPLHFLVEKDI